MKIQSIFNDVIYKNIGGKVEQRKHQKSHKLYLQTYNIINTMISQSNNHMRVQIQKLYPAYQRAQIQQLLASNNNDLKTNEILDYNKQFWNKKIIGKIIQPSKQQIQGVFKKLSQINEDGFKMDNSDADLLDQLTICLNSSLQKNKLVRLIIQKGIHSKILIPLVKQTQNSSLQFLSLKVLKITVDQLLMPNEKNQEAIQILKVLFNQISIDYQQLSNQIIQYLRKTLNAFPSYCYYCLTPKILLKMSKLIKSQFQNNKDIKNINNKIQFSMDSNRVVSLLKICHLSLAASLYYVRDFKSIKSIILNLIEYLLSCPINVQFAIELILLLKKYSKKGLVLQAEICFIFRHNELIKRILKRYNGQKKEILYLFIFGVSLQRVAKQNNIKEDMLYCLETMINKEQGYIKQACWNILANNTSKNCRQAILLRKSLMNKIFIQLKTDNTKNMVGFSLIINDYIQTTSIKLEEKRNIISNIYKPIFELFSSSLPSQLSIAFSLVRKILKDSTLHVQKCEQFKRMGGIPLLQSIITVFSNNKAIKDDAADILGEIKLVLNGEVSDVSLNMSE